MINSSCLFLVVSDERFVYFVLFKSSLGSCNFIKRKVCSFASDHRMIDTCLNLYLNTISITYIIFLLYCIAINISVQAVLVLSVQTDFQQFEILLSVILV